MLNDVFPEFGGEAYRSGRAVRLTLYLPDADAAWAQGPRGWLQNRNADTGSVLG